MAKVSTSAYEAFDLGIFEKGKDVVVVNKDRQIATAKAYAQLMAEQGYTRPVPRSDVKVLGKQALGMFLVGTDSMDSKMRSSVFFLEKLTAHSINAKWE